MRAASRPSVTGGAHGVQVRRPQEAWRRTGGRSRLLLAVAGLLAAGALAGCADNGPADPVAWWHSLEGGRIAEARPAPPNADAPYPRLSTVPTRPQATDAADRARIAGRLIGDRTSAEFGAAAAPLTMPAVTARPAVAAADPDQASATMQAASAPPPPSAPQAPVAAPAMAPVAAASAATPPVSTPPVSAPPVSAPRAPAPTAPAVPAKAAAAAQVATPPAMAATAGLDIPLAPPPPPRLPGVSSVTIPVPPPVPPPPAPPRAVPVVPGQPVPVTFPVGSSALPATAESALRQLAATRGAAAMAVGGFGDAASSDPAAQAAALPLAYARAESIAVALERAGVPRGAIRLTAEAQGHGGVAAVAN